MPTAYWTLHIVLASFSEVCMFAVKIYFMRTFNIQAAVEMYTVQHLTMQQIADKIGYSKCYVGQRLKAAGISSEQGEWVDVECAECGSNFKVERARSRKSANKYCTDACYFAARATTNYKPNYQGQRIGRKVVSGYFVLPPGSIVHHEDGDNLNNDPFNLRVFASQSDHLKYHHGVNPVTPIWDGRTIAGEVFTIHYTESPLSDVAFL
jgi:predicted RNA-binding Zn-ribbon protein involved in translation (DUF1610 family)